MPTPAPERSHLKRFNNILLAIVLVFGVMYLGGEFLIPLIFGLLVATLMLPFCRWMERRGVARGLAATFSAVAVLLVIAVVFTFIAWQVSSFSEDLPQLKKRLLEHVNTGHDYVQNNFGVTIEDVPDGGPVDTTATGAGEAGDPTEQDNVGKARDRTAGGDGADPKGEADGDGADEEETTIPMSEAVGHLFELMKVSFSTLFMLMIIFAYIVLFLYYRRRLREAVVMMFPEHRKERTRHALKEAGTVGQGYLGGMFMVTTILGVLNSIALLVIGIDHPFLFGFVAGYLNFIPFIGTMVGSLLPIMMALLTKDSLLPAVLVGAAFTLNQILEETVLTPNIVGDRVNVNPLFIIFAIVLGNMIWGIAGIVLFIPLTAIAKIVFDHVEELRPLAHFLGQQEDEEPSLFRRLKERLSRKRS